MDRGGGVVAPVRVLIVDDQKPFRDVAARVVAATEPFVVVGAVATGEEALDAVPQLLPDLVLMDVDLPGIDGLEAARRLAVGRPRPAVVLVSTYDAQTVAEAGAGTDLPYIAKADFGSDRLASAWSQLSGIAACSNERPSGTGSAST